MSNEYNERIQPAREVLRKIDEAKIPMPEAPNKAASRFFRYVGVYPLPNLTVILCEERFTEAVQEAQKEGKDGEFAKLAGKLAYCNAMPRLSGISNIRDFIACVTHGMAIEIIPSSEGTRLLYAAQVAHMAHTKRPKKPNKTPQISTATPAATPEQSAS
jgi:hypothetical protein